MPPRDVGRKPAFAQFLRRGCASRPVSDWPVVRTVGSPSQPKRATKTGYQSMEVRLCASFNPGGFMLVGVPEDQFLRSIQRDSYSCGSRSAFMVLRFFGIVLRHGRVKKLLGTNPETGTAIEPMVRLLRRRGLRVGYHPKIGWRGLLAALAKGRVAVVHLDGDHLGVVHGAVRDAEGHHVLIADPSLFRCRSRRITTTQFLRERWTGWALLVSKPSAASRAIASHGRS